jgi:hypothetical protein
MGRNRFAGALRLAYPARCEGAKAAAKARDRSLATQKGHGMAVFLA